MLSVTWKQRKRALWIEEERQFENILVTLRMINGQITKCTEGMTRTAKVTTVVEMKAKDQEEP